jgi:hypothetical protein
MTQPIGTFCMFSQNNCGSSCQFGYLNTTSCQCNPGLLGSKYVATGVDIPRSFIVFNRFDAYNLIFGGSPKFGLAELFPIGGSPLNAADRQDQLDFFDNKCWPDGYTNIVMIKARWCCDEFSNPYSLIGFFDYTLNLDNTITLTRRLQTYRNIATQYELHQAVQAGSTNIPFTFDINTSKTAITWTYRNKTYTYQKDDAFS